MQDFDFFLHLFSILMYLIAFFMILQFYFKLKDEKYWIGFPLAILGFFIHELLEVIDHFTIYETMIFVELFEILSSIILIISVFNLSKEMTKIQTIENE